MTQNDLQVEITNYEPGRLKMRINNGSWYIIPPQMRYGTFRVTEDKRIFMWRGLIQYEFDQEKATWRPAYFIDRFLELFTSKL